jgi:two-component system, OmpR family, response regulator MprA
VRPPVAGARPRLLLAEDDPELADMLGQLLDAEGYEVDAARDGQSALHLALNGRHDVAVLDRGLPHVEGLELLARLRGSGWSAPVLILSAYATLEDRVAGLDAGAEDYLVKPFDVEELLARLRALLRRRPPRGQAHLAVGDLKLNPDTHEVTRGDRHVDLTQREFELLEYLMRNERIVISRQRLLDEVWGYDPFSMTNTIEVFVSNLRRKLESGGEPRLLHTIRGAGYVLRV